MTRNGRTKVVTAAWLALALCVATACSSSNSSTKGGSTSPAANGSSSSHGGAAGIDPSKPPVVIGVVGELSGALAGGFVDEPLVGAKAAADYLNSELGGFGGRKIEVISCDTQTSAAGALTCANKMVAAKAQLVVGFSVFWGSNAIATISKAGIVNQTMSASLQEVVDPNAFPVGGGSFAEYPAQSSYAVSTLHAKSGALVISDAGAINDISIKLFKGPWTQASETFNDVLVPQTSADISPSLARITGFHPDAIMVSLTATQTSQLYSSLHSQGFDLGHVINFSGNADFDNFFNKIDDKAALEGTIYSSEFSSFDDTSDPEAKVYLHAMQTYGKVQGRGSWYEGGFSPVITDYLVAKNVGFDKFDSSTLKDYMSTQKVPVFLGYIYDHSSAPADTPALGAPYVRFLQYTQGKLVNKTSGFINGITGATVAKAPSQYSFLPGS
jgi:branched-chain amino acid transport system substrate-binding protein